MPGPFSDTVMEHFFNPRNVGRLTAPCGEGVAGSVQRGIYVCMYATVVNDVVTQARYLTYGCVPAIAAGSALTDWAHGRKVDEVLAYTPKQLTAVLGGLPPERRFCADLAIEALHSAVRTAINAGEN